MANKFFEFGIRYMQTSFTILIVVVTLGLALNSCQQSNSTRLNDGNSSDKNDTRKITPVNLPTQNKTIWSDRFAAANWQEIWTVRSEKAWGMENAEALEDPNGRFEQVLRVRYPAGSASPKVSRKYDAPLGGTQFYAELGIPGADSLRLSYYLRFSDNFDFVKGGKLPGLFGGKGASGGRVPNGVDGFSTRFMWRKYGDGEVYAYLPTSEHYGTSIGRGNWRFQAGTWHHIEQEVVLNEPGKSNGRIRVWLDGNLVLERSGLLFRTIDTLKVDGIFFCTFFGGSDPSWSTPKDVYTDFADFSVSTVNQ